MAVVVGKSSASWGQQSIGRLVQDRVGPTELRRRAHHILPGFLPLLLWVIPHPHPWIVTSSVAAVIVAAAVWTFVRFHCIQREREGRNDCIVAVAGYSGSILVTLLLFAPHLEVAFLVLGVLAFGDGSATLGGMLFGHRQLSWNAKKTVFGTACFFLIGAPMAAVLYWGEAQAHWTGAHGRGLAFHLHPTAFAVALAMALVATAAGAIAESLPSRTNDNLRVGIVAAIAASLMQLLLVG
jgi:dolichol kinase